MTTTRAPDPVADENSPIKWRVPRLSRRLGIPETTIYNAVKSGELPATRFGEKIILVTLEDGLAWLESKSRPVVGRQEDHA